MAAMTEVHQARRHLMADALQRQQLGMGNLAGQRLGRP
jgi:hypothetical protein